MSDAYKRYEVTGTRTQDIKVYIDSHDVDNIVAQGDVDPLTLCNALVSSFKKHIDIEDDAWIKDGIWIKETSSYFDTFADIRPATENEKACMESIQAIRSSFLVAKLEQGR